MSGSDNAGVLVHNSDAEIEAVLKESAVKLGIRPHLCGLQSPVKLHSAIDLEGHRGRDGHMYLVDFSRTFPPEKPDLKYKSGHLYQLLRPEFLRLYSKPLCNDSFTRFVMHDPLKQEYVREIEEATEFLQRVLVPRCSQALDNVMKGKVRNGTVDGVNIGELVHLHGLPLRWLGRIRKACSSEASRMLLLIEMATRTIKSELRQIFRKTSKTTGMPSQEPYKRAAYAFLNGIFGAGPERQAHWQQLSELIQRKYPLSFGPDDAERVPYLHDIICSFRIFSPQRTEPATADGIHEVLRRRLLLAGPTSLAKSINKIYHFRVRDKGHNRAAHFTINCSTEDVEQLTCVGAVGTADCVVEADADAILAVARDDVLLHSPDRPVKIQGDLETFKLLLPFLSLPRNYFNLANALYDGKYLILKGLESRLGLRFATPLSPATYRESVFSQTDEPTPFDTTDIRQLESRTKSMNVISKCQGILQKHLGNRWAKKMSELCWVKSQAHFTEAFAHLDAALKGDHNNLHTLVEYIRTAKAANRSLPPEAMALKLYGRSFEVQRHERLASIAPLVSRAVKLDGIHGPLYLELAELLEDAGFNRESEPFYIACLAEELVCPRAWQAYGTFLSRQKRFSEAEVCYARLRTLMRALDLNLVSTDE